MNIFQLIQVYLASENDSLSSSNLYHAYQYTMSEDMTVLPCGDVPDLDSLIENIKEALARARDKVQARISSEKNQTPIPTIIEVESLNESSAPILGRNKTASQSSTENFDSIPDLEPVTQNAHENPGSIIVSNPFYRAEPLPGKTGIRIKTEPNDIGISVTKQEGDDLIE